MQPDLFKKTFAGYRAPTPVTIPVFNEIQQKVLELANYINVNCPESREKALALTDLQSARMWANASVAIHTEPTT